jgi:hypothetical protein
MPLDTPEWDFVCWTPGDLSSAVFLHSRRACRDALKKQRDDARAEVDSLRSRLIAVESQLALERQRRGCMYNLGASGEAGDAD